MYTLTHSPEELKKQAEVRKKIAEDQEVKSLTAKIDSEVRNWFSSGRLAFSLKVSVEEFGQNARNIVLRNLKSQGYKVSQETNLDYRGDTSTVILIEF